MDTFLDIAKDVIGDALSITGMVVILMMLIEFVNRATRGRAFGVLGGSRWRQVLLGAGMGLIPGCFGGFAVVSMYSHRVIGFGALVAMMIASSGDEAFFMLAMIPREALIVSAIIFVIAVAIGLLADKLFKGKRVHNDVCGGSFELHDEDFAHHHPDEGQTQHKHPHAARYGTALIMLLFTAYFIFAFLTNGEEHGEEAGGLDLDVIEEKWLNLLFAVIAIALVISAFLMPYHVVEEHLWNHVIRKHLLSVFLWTAGMLLVIQTGLHYFDIGTWTSENTVWMIVLAAVVGLIPESGPHLLFVSLFASGNVPFSVLLSSCISQDGHAGLPLLADDKRGFFKAKMINAAVALTAGIVCYTLGF